MLSFMPLLFCSSESYLFELRRRAGLRAQDRREGERARGAAAGAAAQELDRGACGDGHQYRSVSAVRGEVPADAGSDGGAAGLRQPVLGADQVAVAATRPGPVRGASRDGRVLGESVHRHAGRGGVAPQRARDAASQGAHGRGQAAGRRRDSLRDPHGADPARDLGLTRAAAGGGPGRRRGRGHAPHPDYPALAAGGEGGVHALAGGDLPGAGGRLPAPVPGFQRPQGGSRADQRAGPGREAPPPPAHPPPAASPTASPATQPLPTRSLASPQLPTRDLRSSSPWAWADPRPSTTHRSGPSRSALLGWGRGPGRPVMSPGRRGREVSRMTGNRGPDPTPADNPGPDPKPADDRGPDPTPPEDEIRWLIYLAIGLVAFLALVAWPGFHNAMGH